MGLYIKGIDYPKEPTPIDIYTNGEWVDWTVNDDDRGTFVEVHTPHGDLIDRSVLKEAVLKWMPPDPGGKEEKEYPFETDICVSLLMEIDEQEVIIESEH